MSKEKDLGLDSRLPSHRDLISRVLNAILPKCLHYSANRPLPSCKAPKGSVWVFDTLFFSSSFPLLWASAAGRDLKIADFPPLPQSRHVSSKLMQFELCFVRCRSSSRYPLLFTLGLIFKAQIIEGVGIHFLYCLAAIAQVILFKAIISYLIPLYGSTGDGKTFGYGVALLVASTAGVFGAQLLKARAYYVMSMTGGEIRTLLAGGIALKALDTSSSARREKKRHDELDKEGHQSSWSIGAILNIANTDTERVQLGLRQFNDAWPIFVLGPFVGGLSFWLVGWPGWAALALMYLMQIPVPFMVRTMQKLRIRINEVTHERVGIVHELITGIRLLKAFAWEDIYLEFLRDVRHQEVKLNKKRTKINSAMLSVAGYAVRGPAVLAVALWSLHHTIDINSSAELLTTVYLYYHLASLTTFFPEGIVAAIDAWQSILRVEEFLLVEDVYPRDCKGRKNLALKESIKMDQAEFSWTKRPARTDFRLHTLTLEVKQEELLAITGATSSGKTTLAASLAGQMFKQSGSARVQNMPIYVPATTWIRQASVRENVVFGLPFQPACFWQVIAACGLKTDLHQFPHGDLTSLGERGINLSGGQRARIGLARGLYATMLANENNNIIIMDDPFAALDASTGLTVFEDAILQRLSNYTRVLVTHQVQYLGRCDRVVWMEDGGPKAIDSFKALMESNAEFAAFMGKKGQVSERTSMEAEAEDRMPTYNQGQNLIEEEERHEGHSVWRLMADFVNARKWWWFILIMLSIHAISQIANVLYGIIYAWWLSAEFDVSKDAWIGIIIIAMIGQAFLFQATVWCTQLPLQSCSERLCNRATKGILKTTVAFLDANPAGRIINRFTQDVNMTDNVVPVFVWFPIIITWHNLSIVGFIVAYIPLVAAIFLPWLAISGVFVLFYRPTPLAIKRIEAPLSSNLITHVSEMVSGASTLRAYPSARDDFVEQLFNRIDSLNQVHLVSFAVHGWISIRSACIAAVLYLIIGLLGLRMRHAVLPGILTSLLISSLDIMWNNQKLLDTLAELQRGANCIERLSHYAKGIVRERAPRQPRAKAIWPEKGEIAITDASMRYRDGLPLALRNVNVNISGGEKIGIIGRTGAGKSTLYSLLLGFVDPCKGSILIDRVDISNIGLHDLREAIAIIPQEPTLFAGTVRSNLDPLTRLSEENLMAALRLAGLESLKLETRIAAGGGNLSSGQRQLLSLTRAIVRRTKIILIDEATSNVDYQTDAKIQKMLREECKQCTVITIAHRISTVLQYDRIVVMEAGEVAEFDSPQALWERAGLFKELADRSGVTQHQIYGDSTM